MEEVLLKVVRGGRLVGEGQGGRRSSLGGFMIGFGEGW